MLLDPKDMKSASSEGVGRVCDNCFGELFPDVVAGRARTEQVKKHYMDHAVERAEERATEIYGFWTSGDGGTLLFNEDEQALNLRIADLKKGHHGRRDSLNWGQSLAGPIALALPRIAQGNFIKAGRGTGKVMTYLDVKALLIPEADAVLAPIADVTYAAPGVAPLRALKNYYMDNAVLYAETDAAAWGADEYTDSSVERTTPRTNDKTFKRLLEEYNDGQRDKDRAKLSLGGWKNAEAGFIREGRGTGKAMVHHQKLALLLNIINTVAEGSDKIAARDLYAKLSSPQQTQFGGGKKYKKRYTRRKRKTKKRKTKKRKTKKRKTKKRKTKKRKTKKRKTMKRRKSTKRKKNTRRKRR